MRWLAVIGTRPEATKMQSVVAAWRRRNVPVEVWTTGQHSTLLRAAADTPRLQALLDGAISLQCATSPDPATFADRVRRAVAERLRATEGVAGVIVQGDTASAYGGALAAREVGVRLLHVEAGVRSGDLSQPWPEEVFRVAIDRMARWCACPTRQAADHLFAERVAADIRVTGQTGIDDLYAEGVMRPDVRERRVLITLHRREMLEGLADVAAALEQVAVWRPDWLLVWPAHPNPMVQQAVGGLRQIQVMPPLGALAFRRLLAGSSLVVTDSGGVQEEAAAYGVPCLVARDVTDRPETVTSGHARLVGRDPAGIALAVKRELDDPTLRADPFTGYGNGDAGAQIADWVLESR